MAKVVFVYERIVVQHVNGTFSGEDVCQDVSLVPKRYLRVRDYVQQHEGVGFPADVAFNAVYFKDDFFSELFYGAPIGAVADKSAGMTAGAFQLVQLDRGNNFII